MDDESPSGNTREMKDTKKGGKGMSFRIRNSKNKYPRKKMEWNSGIFAPGITLYSSASRLSSMTSAVGNGFSCGLLSPLSSDILTVLPDFLPLQRINRGCIGALAYLFFLFFFFSRLVWGYTSIIIDSRIVVDAFSFFLLNPVVWTSRYRDKELRSIS